MSKLKSDTNWMSLSDMMTGLMLVFLFIAIIAINDVRSIAQEYQDTRVQIYNDLVEVFDGYKEEWSMEIDEKTLSIRFTNPDLLFRFDSDVIRPAYRSILDEFIPKYLTIINMPQYRELISEIRIEGHTSQDRPNDVNYYMYNIDLSQRRANAVLKYMIEHESFLGLPSKERSHIQFWITANGLGYNRALDKEGDLFFKTNQEQDRDRSRRVEFRILTDSEILLENIIK